MVTNPQYKEGAYLPLIHIYKNLTLIWDHSHLMQYLLTYLC